MYVPYLTDTFEPKSERSKTPLYHHVGLYAVVLAGEHISCAPKTGLDLVGDKESAVLVAGLTQGC